MNERMRAPVQDWDAGYHDKYEKWTERFKKSYEKLYRSIYERALLLVCARVKDPLSKAEPNVLLCGTAASETTRNFVRFVQGENSDADIQILDLNSQPLETSQRKIASDETIDASKVHFTQANALEIPFANNSIDLIETDFFLQFFSPEDKQKLINEWARILSDGGAIMTREFLPDNPISGIIDNMRRKAGQRMHLETYAASEAEIKELFEQAGLQADIVPMKYGPFPSHILKHIIAYRKKA